MREILFRGKPVNKAIYTNFEKKFKNASFFSNGFVVKELQNYCDNCGKALDLDWSESNG